MTQPLSWEDAVFNRYSVAARKPEKGLCCPPSYSSRYLKIIPPEVLQTDYGCGDPTRYVKPGDVVLDLGSGSGKVCFIAAQIVGPTGRVIGVDNNPEMLRLARKAAPQVAELLGTGNVTFRHGHIDDLGLDLDAFSEWLAAHPINNLQTYTAAEKEKEDLRRDKPLVPTSSVTLAMSNCVFNLVAPEKKPRLFSELFRVVMPGGRVAISDIVSSRPIPEHLRQSTELRGACIAGACLEEEFLTLFELAGFREIKIMDLARPAWKIVDGIEFRSMTVTATKRLEARKQFGPSTVIYRGPWKSVEDDSGIRFHRGKRQEVTSGDCRSVTQESFDAELLTLPNGGEENNAASASCCTKEGQACCESATSMVTSTDCCADPKKNGAN